MYLISACLCGVNCKYNGANNRDPLFVSWLKAGMALPVCPEQLGGLPTPRVTCEIIGGDGESVIKGHARVAGIDGLDHTETFVRGAFETLYIAQCCQIKEAVFKAHSPSCGVGSIYDGCFSRTLIPGDGVTTALLRHNGITVYSEVQGRSI